MIRRFVDRYMPLREGEAGGAAGGADAAAAAAAAAGAAKPWHDGVDAETVGFWQNKGWKSEDPKLLSAELTKSYRSLEGKLGAGPDNLLVLPKADAKPEDWKAFHQRLGAPADAKEYDFSTVKMGDQPLSADLDAAMRSALANAFVPKDKATGIAAAVAKVLESSDVAKGTVNAAKLAEEKTKLAADWKNNYDFNHLKAMEGARRLGITPEAIKALENQIGYAAVMESMRKIGVGTSEDSFIERGATGGGVPHTREGAISRKAELMADRDWGGRYLKGGAKEAQEMNALNMMIDGEA